MLTNEINDGIINLAVEETPENKGFSETGGKKNSFDPDRKYDPIAKKKNKKVEKVLDKPKAT